MLEFFLIFSDFFEFSFMTILTTKNFLKERRKIKVKMQNYPLHVQLSKISFYDVQLKEKLKLAVCIIEYPQGFTFKNCHSSLR